ncbi:putative restriction endonuclease [bacterium A37T11]|nr:putative restriction endonuclease [bacterium A37T11]
MDHYAYAFTHLKRAPTRYGAAPHKPVLLLSLLELVGKGAVGGNRFAVNAELVGTFKENWELLVTTPHQADFTQPFYYLQSDKAGGEPFWFLIPHPGCQINAHIKSVQRLHEVLDYGCFSEELFVLLCQPENREYLQQLLLNTYLPHTEQAFRQHKAVGDGYLKQVDDYIEGAKNRLPYPPDY